MRDTNKDKRIFGAVRDYYNAKGGRVEQIALYLTGRKHLKDLTEQEHSDIRKIRQNMRDTIYMSSFVG